MILEIATLTIHPDAMNAFEAAFPRAAAVVATTPGYISHELLRCVEVRGIYGLQIRWTHLDAHLVDFRQSHRVGEFRAILGPYFAAPPAVQHFEFVEWP
jgi:heme-degrading monooxygenase HmoA